MRHAHPSEYARAFMESIDGKSVHEAEAALKRLVALIEKRGDWPRRGQIQKACEAAWRKKHSRPLAVVESARPLAADQKQYISHIIKGHAEDAEESVNPELVAGVRITVDDRELDASLRHLLNKLFAQT